MAYVKKADREKIEGEGSSFDAPPEKKERVKKGKNSFTQDEVKEQFNLLFEGIAKAFGRDYLFEPSDFKQEACGFIRICEKFPVVADVFSWFDPVLIVLGFFKKFRDMPATPKKQKQPQQPMQQADVGLQLVNNAQ